MTRPWLDANGNTFPYRKLIHVASLKARIGWQSLRTEEFVDEGPYCVTGTDFQNGRINWSTAYHVSAERYEMDRNIQLNEGDLLVTKDGTIGKVAVVHGLDAPATLNSGVFVVRPKTGELSTDFLGWVIRSKVFDDFVAFNFSGSTINHLYQNVFETFRFPYPDLATQRQIADFLDRETVRIDLLIEKKQKLVALLGDHWGRFAFDLFSIETPTRFGFEKTNWKNEKLKFLSPRVTVGIVVTPAAYYTDGGVPAIRATNIRAMDIRMDDMVSITEEGHQINRKSALSEGDVVVVRTGQPGTAAVVPKVLHGANCIDVILIKKSKRYLSDLLAHFLNSSAARAQYSSGSSGAIQQHFNISIASNLVVPVPPLHEQNRILEILDLERRRVNKLTAKLNASIARLKEYRSALITAAVTGQIDVTSYTKSGATDRRLDAIEKRVSA